MKDTDGVETHYFWEKEGHIFCDFRFSSSFQKIDMILLTRPEGGLIGLISLITTEASVPLQILLAESENSYYLQKSKECAPKI